MREIVIEGLDGAGKSTVAELLAHHFSEEGQRVQVVAPYREVTNEHGEIYHLWGTPEGSRHAIELLKSALAHARERAHDDNVDLLIFDRHWMTAFSEIGQNPQMVDLWGEDMPSTAYLHVSPETARLRAENDPDAPWMERHAHYAERYWQLCHQNPTHVLGIYRNDNDVALDSIVRSIVWDMSSLR